MTALDPELFLPEPQPREVKYTVISVDDHVVEPPHIVRGSASRASLQDRAPADRRDRERGTRSGSSRAQQFTQVGHERGRRARDPRR